jgi:hypothetical protein
VQYVHVTPPVTISGLRPSSVSADSGWQAAAPAVLRGAFVPQSWRHVACYPSKPVLHRSEVNYFAMRLGTARASEIPKHPVRPCLTSKPIRTGICAQPINLVMATPAYCHLFGLIRDQH